MYTDMYETNFCNVPFYSSASKQSHAIAYGDTFFLNFHFECPALFQTLCDLEVLIYDKEFKLIYNEVFNSSDLQNGDLPFMIPAEEATKLFRKDMYYASVRMKQFAGDTDIIQTLIYPENCKITIL